MRSRRAVLTLTLIALFCFVNLMAHAAQPACDPGNGGITLPPGFCAFVAADGLGEARHAVVAPNGDLYVALQNGGAVALRDTNGDGRYDVKEKFGEGSTTGIGFYNGYLYVATVDSVLRYKMTPGQLKPTGPVEVVVGGMTARSEHHDKGLTFDGKGYLYINIGTPSNSCQVHDRQKGSPGIDPCPILKKHGGIWKFDANKLNQTQADGVRLVTGLRQEPAITWHDGAVYVVMNNRDQLDTLWPAKFTAEENATRPAEVMYRAVPGSNFGWPYCYYDYVQKKLVLSPEYGGDGKIVGRCSSYSLPIASFPAHWAPLGVVFYNGHQFPAQYRGGAFIAFHGSWNRAPFPQKGYNVAFQPFKDGKPSGKFEVFADGFAGKAPLKSSSQAVARPDGVAVGPDGSLYITDSERGKIWRVLYRPGRENASLEHSRN